MKEYRMNGRREKDERKTKRKHRNKYNGTKQINMIQSHRKQKGGEQSD